MTVLDTNIDLNKSHNYIVTIQYSEDRITLIVHADIQPRGYVFTENMLVYQVLDYLADPTKGRNHGFPLRKKNVKNLDLFNHEYPVLN